MSPPKLISLLTGVFIAMIIAVASSAMAQDGLRLFKPYSPEMFSGGRRSNDGIYGSVSGIYWSISTPTDGYIGATTVNGKDETRWTYNGAKVFEQTNSVKINMMGPTTTLGTRFEVGNRRGQYGWLIGGYGLPGQSHSMNAQSMSMTIRDEGNFTYQPLDPFGPLWGLESATWYIWDRNNDTMYSPTAQSGPNYPYANWQAADVTSISGIGYLWGIIGRFYDTDDGEVYVGAFAPLPIWFQNVDIRVSSSHLSTELMYTYRPHPFTWGAMELLAGARYWEFDDKFGFDGTGPRYVNSPTSFLDGPFSLLAGMSVDARGINRVFGPQVGMKLSRSNARWTFGAEGRLTAGINFQTLETSGYIGTNYDAYGDNYIYDPGNSDGLMIMPVGLQHGNSNFGHKKNKTVLSPIGELRLTADWQWTSAISFFGAVDGMFAGNIARGVRITDYVVRSDGTIFGIRGNDRNTNVFVYGVELGVKMNR